MHNDVSNSNIFLLLYVEDLKTLISPVGATITARRDICNFLRVDACSFMKTYSRKNLRLKASDLISCIKIVVVNRQTELININNPHIAVKIRETDYDDL